MSAESMKFIDTEDRFGLETILNNLPEDISITDLVNQDGFTLLHRCAFSNKKHLLDLVLGVALK